MKKGSSLKKKAEESAAAAEEEKEEAEQQIQTEQEVEEAEEACRSKHHLFENDNWEQTLHNAVWFGRKIPGKKRGLDQPLVISKKGPSAPINHKAQPKVEDPYITLDSVKQAIQNVEELYSDASLHFQREWESLEVRNTFKQQLAEGTSVNIVAQLLLELDVGFCQPVYLKLKDDKGRAEQSDEEMESEEGEENGGGAAAEKKEGSSHIQRMKVLTFKFWSHQEMRNTWRNYIFQECADRRAHV